MRDRPDSALPAGSKKEKKQPLDDKDWQEELLRELDGYQPMAGR